MRINDERIAALLDKNLKLQEDFKELVEHEAAAKAKNHELEVTLQRYAHDQGHSETLRELICDASSCSSSSRFNLSSLLLHKMFHLKCRAFKRLWL